MITMGQGEHFLVTLAQGEAVLARLTQFCFDHKLLGASITGIGAVCDIELGYYDLANKTYIKKLFSEEHELANAIGNYSIKEHEPFIHMHVGISDKNFQMFGGHLFEAKVAATAEFTITELNILPKREYNNHIGLHLICGIYE